MASFLGIVVVWYEQGVIYCAILKFIQWDYTSSDLSFNVIYGSWKINTEAWWSIPGKSNCRLSWSVQSCWAGLFVILFILQSWKLVSCTLYVWIMHQTVMAQPNIFHFIIIIIISLYIPTFGGMASCGQCFLHITTLIAKVLFPFSVYLSTNLSVH